jgi:hypothetical protein
MPPGRSSSGLPQHQHSKLAQLLADAQGMSGALSALLGSGTSDPCTLLEVLQRTGVQLDAPAVGSQILGGASAAAGTAGGAAEQESWEKLGARGGRKQQLAAPDGSGGWGFAGTGNLGGEEGKQLPRTQASHEGMAGGQQVGDRPAW